MATDFESDYVELLVMGWIRLFIENKMDNIPIEIQLVCKRFFGAFIDSKILTMNETNLLLKYIKKQTKNDWYWTLIYRATEHGFSNDAFYEHCNNKKNTVVIVYNKHDRIFGGYTPCPWRNSSDSFDDRKDKTGSTFLFLLRTKVKDGQTIIKLKESKYNTAVAYYGDTAFDFGHNDFYLCHEKVQTRGVSSDCCFDWKHRNKQECTYLFGDRAGGKPEEIEIFQLF